MFILLLSFCTIVCTYRGQSYQNGEQFTNPDERCEDCVCRGGTIQCQRKQCDIPNCRDPVYPPGACCPVCTGMALLFVFYLFRFLRKFLLYIVCQSSG